MLCIKYCFYIYSHKHGGLRNISLNSTNKTHCWNRNLCDVKSGKVMFGTWVLPYLFSLVLSFVCSSFRPVFVFRPTHVFSFILCLSENVFSFLLSPHLHSCVYCIVPFISSNFSSSSFHPSLLPLTLLL